MTKRPDFTMERSAPTPVCGIDEAGRGPIAGPVVAACVFVPQEAQSLDFWAHVNDSKRVSPTRRAALEPLIKKHTLWGLGKADPLEIDAHNILNATFLAMERAVYAMETRPPTLCALIDGNRLPKTFPVPTQAIIKGDTLSLSIAAASILAKVERDRIMEGLAVTHPVYGWMDNKGYPTKAHLEALERHGPCPQHRKTFAPVKKVLASDDATRYILPS